MHLANLGQNWRLLSRAPRFRATCWALHNYSATCMYSMWTPHTQIDWRPRVGDVGGKAAPCFAELPSCGCRWSSAMPRRMSPSKESLTRALSTARSVVGSDLAGSPRLGAVTGGRGVVWAHMQAASGGHLMVHGECSCAYVEGRGNGGMGARLGIAEATVTTTEHADVTARAPIALTKPLLCAGLHLCRMLMHDICVMSHA